MPRASRVFADCNDLRCLGKVMHPTSEQTQDAAGAHGQISLLAWLVVLAKHKRLVIGVPFVVTMITAVIVVLLPNTYTATTKILPPQHGQSTAAAVLGQLGALAGLAGGQLAVRNPDDLYVTMLRTRTVVDSLIEQFDLKNVYGTKGQADTGRALEKATEIVVGKDGVITIHVDDRQAKRAAQLATAYVDELYKMTQTLAITEASQRRLFFERQLKTAKNELAEAEMGLRKTQETTGLIKLDDQGKAIIESVARMQAQVAAKEVQLGAMRSFITETNPDYILARRELAELKAQLARAEQNPKRGGVLVATERIPEAGLQYARRYRDVKYYETIFELLAKQYEIAKIDEARDASLIQVLDKAIEPEEKSKPKRALIVVVSAFVSLLLAVLWAFLKESAERAKTDPQQTEVRQFSRQHLSI